MFFVSAEVTEESLLLSCSPEELREDTLFVMKTTNNQALGRIEDSEEIIMTPAGTPSSVISGIDSPLLVNTTGSSPSILSAEDSPLLVHKPLIRSGEVLTPLNRTGHSEFLQKSNECLPSLIKNSDPGGSCSPLEFHLGHFETELAEAMQEEIIIDKVSDNTEKNPFNRAVSAHTDDDSHSSDQTVTCDVLPNVDSLICGSVAIEQTDIINLDKLEESHKSDSFSDSIDFSKETCNLLSPSSSGTAARLKVKNFVESLINHENDRNHNDDLPDMNQVFILCCWFFFCCFFLFG